MVPRLATFGPGPSPTFRVVPGWGLAEAPDTTRRYLPHILHPLVKARWVQLTPGPHGGHAPRVAPKGISVLQLSEVGKGPTAGDTCVLNGELCPQDQLCALHAPGSTPTKELGQMTLADAWGASCGSW